MKTIDQKKITVSMLKEGILYLHLKAGSEIELADAVLAIEAMGKLGGGKKYPVLIDAGEFASVDKEVRIFSASPESNIYTVADAIAYISVAQKLIADFYIKYNKPVVPTKAFPTKNEAMSWLKTFLPN
jgi:hypothetical protein